METSSAKPNSKKDGGTTLSKDGWNKSDRTCSKYKSVAGGISKTRMNKLTLTKFIKPILQKKYIY